MTHIIHNFTCIHNGLHRQFKVTVNVDNKGKTHFSNFKILNEKNGKSRFVSFDLRQKLEEEHDIAQTAKSTFKQSQGIR